MNLRFCIIVFILLSINACQSDQKPGTKNFLDDKLLVGEWLGDSSSTQQFFFDRLIILDDGTFYLFSGTDGGSLLKQGTKSENTTLNTKRGETLNITLLDSDRVCISGGWSRSEDFYGRSQYGDYRADLKDYLKADSLRNNLIGWWKLISSKRAVELINYDGYCEKFTLNIREDGRAVFFLENKLDSAVYYSYVVNTDGIDFNRGCIVGSDCKVGFDKTGKMKLVLDRFTGDTLLLERLTEIK